MAKLLPQLLIPWFQEKSRRLPWREEPTPYHVWLSEIMLQQTRIEAVIPYYHRFLQHFPTVAHLAAAEDDVLMKCWEGLGYYSRARNLKKAAIQIMTEHNGQMPTTEKELLALPGIGPYTAGAIASIAFGRPSPAVDGNVLRVMTRVLADERDISLPATKQAIHDHLAAMYPTGENAAAFTQALMEVGQTACLPNGAPKCSECPLQTICLAHKAGREECYPNKPKKAPRKAVIKTVFLFRHGEKYALRRRPPEGLLAGLWEFPNVDASLSAEDALAVAEGFGLSPKEVLPLPAATHIFTHLEWHMTGYLVTCQAESDAFVFASPSKITEAYALASAFAAYRKLL